MRILSFLAAAMCFQCLAIPPRVLAQVFINEVLASNRNTIVDEDGDAPDLVELYNAGETEVPLLGYGLSDDPAEPHLWVFPEVSLSPGSFLVIFCSGKDRVVLSADDAPPIIHSSFKLSSGGENVVFSDGGGQVIDELEFPQQTTDRPFGRFPDATGEFQYMLFPTPGEANDGHVSPNLIPDSLLRFEPESGKYTQPIEVQMLPVVPFEGFEIRFRRDGALPVSDSELYEAPIPLRRDVVFRAAGFLDGRRVTSIVAKSYFGFGGRSRNIRNPVISISMAPFDFRAVQLNVSGRGMESERSGAIEIFKEDGTTLAATGLGLRLHGGAGRMGDVDIKKSYRAYFRSIYGSPRLEAPGLIPSTEVDSFDKLVLRAGYNDSFRFGGSYIRDQVVRDLQEDMGGFVPRGAWYNMFINMEYRGVYNVVERIDEEMLNTNFPDEKQWDVLKTGEEIQDGDDVEWKRLKEFVSRQDLRDDALYEQALGMIDVENFTGYMIVNIWCQTGDWPGNNWYAVRPHREGGKWMFISWDAEFALGLAPIRFDGDSFSTATGGDAPVSIILRGLLQSPRYQRLYLEEFERHLEGALSVENVLAVIDQHRRAIGPDIAGESTLFPGASVAAWQAVTRFIQEFASNRTPFIWDFTIKSEFFTLPIATSAAPDRAAAGTRITLEGLRFTPATEISFGAISVADVEFVSETSLRVTVPVDATLNGFPDITTVDATGGAWTARGLLEVTDDVVLETFERGDADGNGRANITDAVQILQYLFRASEDPRCEDALDVDDSGKLNLTDAVFLLGYLLRPDAAIPPAPVGNCGADPTVDELKCAGPTACR